MMLLSLQVVQMFTKEENKQLRLEFWNRFYKMSGKKRIRSRKPAKWIMNDTGIRQLKLKFHYDEQIATAGIDIETRNMEKRIELFGKLESLKSKFEAFFGKSLAWEFDHILPTGKSISRVYIILRDVNIYCKDDWDKVNRFFYDHMTLFEDLFNEYKDYFRYAKPSS
jgi:hypothetical protein